MRGLLRIHHVGCQRRVCGLPQARRTFPIGRLACLKGIVGTSTISFCEGRNIRHVTPTCRGTPTRRTMLVFYGRYLHCDVK